MVTCTQDEILHICRTKSCTYSVLYTGLCSFDWCVTVCLSLYHQQTGVRLFRIIFISIDYTTYVAIMSRLLRLCFCKNPNDYSRLLHYLKKGDYFTYGTAIISLILFGLYYIDYCYYHTIICIIIIANYYFYYSI